MSKESQLAISVNALAVAIGSIGFDAEEMALLAGVFVQIGDTLATMAAQKAISGNISGEDCK